MDFLSSYLNALTLQAASPREALPEKAYFAGTFYEPCETAPKELPAVLSGGTVEIASELTLSFTALPCRMLLYTKEGEGCLRLRGEDHILKAGSLLWLDCTDAPFSLHAESLPWRYIVFSFAGGGFSVYEILIPFEGFLLTQPDPHASILRSIGLLLAGSAGAALPNKLRDAGLITDILTELFLSVLPAEEAESAHAPYLSELKHYLDHCYTEPLKLDALEERFHMSKYHICRNFSAAFGSPPLKYLNKKRLEAAANLLFSTDKKIHEIALAVGFESTNHFISLFKKEYGATPQAYREAHLHP
ncbi:MAG: AraC family transcriptional regulator [Bacteroidales bacterium]|nr:AraC family transcriptional regulator [Bacteroidales bacterium]MCM1414840.1 AraC family transcriptional regulator [bacterium]MCM1422471.1 AraC family transcriptional regulator [bacterium]